MEQDSRQIAVMRLMNVDPEQAVLAINKLFTGPDGTTKSTLKAQAEPSTRTLIVHGTHGDIEQIRGMLAQMGEDVVVGQRAAGQEGIVVVPLTGRSARSVISQIEQIWPTIHKNKIRLITPSASTPGATDGAFQGAAGPMSGIVERRSSDLSPVGVRARPTDASGLAPGEDSPNRSQRDPTSRESGHVPPVKSKAVSPVINREAAAQLPDDLQLAELLGSGEQDVRLPLSFVSQISASNESETTKTAAANAEEQPSQLPSGAAAQSPSDKPQGAQDGENPIADTPSKNTPADGAQSGNQPSQPEATKLQVGDGAPVFIAPGPGGIMIASDDKKALDDLETLMRTLAMRSAGGQDYTVFYLKHAKAQTIEPLIRQILTAGSTTTNPLNNLGGFGGRGGFGFGGNQVAQTTVSSSSSSPTIIPDSRLNALFVQASSRDLDLIEQWLQVLDQPESPEDVSVVPKPRMIPVKYKSAEQIANVIKEVYSNRIIGGGGGGGGGRGGRGGDNQDPRAAFFAAIANGGGGRGGFGGRGGRGGGGANQTEEAPQMTVGVDTSSNSIIVAAPELLFLEVKQLVEQIDQATSDANNDVMRVVKLRNANGTTLQQSLQQILGDDVQTTQRRNSSNNSSRGGRGNQNSGFGGFNQGGGNFGGFGRGNFGGGQGNLGGGQGNFGGGRGGFGGGGFGGGGGNRGGFGGGRGGGRGGRGN
jgi:type II secretory pathway component GspD/PulD (secretin)